MPGRSKAKKTELVRKESAYSPEFCKDLVEWMSSGHTLTTFSECLKRKYGISCHVKTIYRWMGENPEFKEAFLRAKEAGQCYFEELLLLATKGITPVELKEMGSEGISVSGLMFIMRSRYPQDYGQTYKITAEMEEKSEGNKLEGSLRLQDLTDETIKMMIRDASIKERDERNQIPGDVECVRHKQLRGGRTTSGTAKKKPSKKLSRVR